MSKRIIHSEQAPAAIGPYSQAVRAGDFVFCSGQVPVDPATGHVVPGGVAEQTRQVLDNLQAVLKQAGAGFDKVVKTTVFLVDLADFAVVNDVYAERFDREPPARACIEVGRLPKDVRVEIEAIAYLGE